MMRNALFALALAAAFPAWAESGNSGDPNRPTPPGEAEWPGIPLVEGTRLVAEEIGLTDPADALVILWSHGTTRPQKQEDCTVFGNRVPPVIAKLDGTRLNGAEVHVIRLCSHATEPPRRETAGAQVHSRADEIRAITDRLRAAGVPPGRIILAGHSNGGWSSLMMMSEHPDDVAGVLAFSPAFAGPKSEEAQYPWWRQEALPRQRRELVSGGRIDALVFVWKGDPFGEPEDMAFLHDAFPGSVEVVAGECDTDLPHSAVFRPCDAEDLSARITAFLAKETAAP